MNRWSSGPGFRKQSPHDTHVWPRPAREVPLPLGARQKIRTQCRGRYRSRSAGEGATTTSLPGHATRRHHARVEGRSAESCIPRHVSPKTPHAIDRQTASYRQSQGHRMLPNGEVCPAAIRAQRWLYRGREQTGTRQTKSALDAAQAQALEAVCEQQVQLHYYSVSPWAGIVGHPWRGRVLTTTVLTT
jgi:hypothetical protein